MCVGKKEMPGFLKNTPKQYIFLRSQGRLFHSKKMRTKTCMRERQDEMGNNKLKPNLSVIVFNSRGVSFTKCSLDKTKHQWGFSNITGTKYNYPIVVALFWHCLFQLYITATLKKTVRNLWLVRSFCLGNNILTITVS